MPTSLFARLMDRRDDRRARALRETLGRDGQVVDEAELDEDGDRLAWDISLDKADRQDVDEVLVDAKTGEVVSTDG